MGIFGDIGNALTGTKSDSTNRSDRLNEERRIERSRQEAAAAHARAREAFGEGALNLGTGGGIVAADGRAISDAEYDAVYGSGSAALFRGQAAANPNAVPTGADNTALQQGQDLLTGTTPAAPRTLDEALAAASGTLAPFQGPGVFNGPVGTPRRAVKGGSTPGGAAIALEGVPTGPAPAAPTIDTKGINKNLGALDTYQNALWQLSQDNTGLSLAEEQLKKATELANIQAGIATEGSQRSALGMARSSRNRGDRALLERQAVGEAGFIGQDAARTAALVRAQNEGDLAEVRAKEVDADRRFKKEAIEAAAGLGLNVAALEFQISDANVQSANNWINNEFAQANLGMQLDQQQTENLMNYTRDMAALQFQYDQMSVQDQQETDRRLMDKYTVDQNVALELKKMKDARKMNWNSFLTTMAAGAVAGASTVASSYVGAPAAAARAAGAAAKAAS